MKAPRCQGVFAADNPFCFRRKDVTDYEIESVQKYGLLFHIIVTVGLLGKASRQGGSIIMQQQIVLQDVWFHDALPHQRRQRGCSKQVSICLQWICCMCMHHQQTCICRQPVHTACKALVMQNVLHCLLSGAGLLVVPNNML